MTTDLIMRVNVRTTTTILNEDTQPVIRAIGEYHTQLAKMSFDEIFDLTAGVYFNFYNIPGIIYLIYTSIHFKNRTPPNEKLTDIVYDYKYQQRSLQR